MSVWSSSVDGPAGAKSGGGHCETETFIPEQQQKKDRQRKTMNPIDALAVSGNKRGALYVQYPSRFTGILVASPGKFSF